MVTTELQTTCVWDLLPFGCASTPGPRPGTCSTAGPSAPCFKRTLAARSQLTKGSGHTAQGCHRSHQSRAVPTPPRVQTGGSGSERQRSVCAQDSWQEPWARRECRGPLRPSARPRGALHDPSQCLPIDHSFWDGESRGTLQINDDNITFVQSVCRPERALPNTPISDHVAFKQSLPV